MIGIGIDSNTNDVHFDEVGNLVMVHDADAVAEHVMQRVKTYEGEWFLDTSAGIPWLQDIIANGYDPALGEALIKAEVHDTKGVLDIEEFNVSFNNSIRVVTFQTIGVTTIYDED